MCLAAIRDATARVKAAQDLEASARRLAMLLEDLPGFAFRGRFDPDWRVDYVSKVITEHLDLLRRLIGEDIRIETSLAPGLWAVRGDEAQLAQAVTTAAPAPAGAGRTVLLVEDDHDVCQVLQTFMARHGYRVASAATPGEALQAANRMESLDLLVSDVVLPAMNGRDLYARMAVSRRRAPAVLV